MNRLVEKIVEQKLSNKILRASQLKRLLSGSDQRRHNLVNRALKTGELIRLQRGLYILDDRFRDFPCHPFAVAQALVPGSYISLETALAYHGWIPEAVYETASITPGRKSRKFEHGKMGVFSFHPLAIRSGHFLEMVSRKQVNDQSVFLAKPVRALVDLICKRKMEWKGIHLLSEDLRIESSLLHTISKADISILEKVYRHRRVRSFLSFLSGDVAS